MILFADEMCNNRRFEEKSLEKRNKVFNFTRATICRAFLWGVNHFIRKKGEEKKKGFLITDSYNHHYPTNYSSENRWLIESSARSYLKSRQIRRLIQYFSNTIEQKKQLL